jgi:hypothetical protein
MNSGIQILTFVHVLISLVGIASGFVVIFGFLTGRRLDRWTSIFLATTVLTSLTGFLFPIERITPGIVIGIVSLLVLAVAIIARYKVHLAGRAGPVYVVCSVIALYFNVLVLIVQSFQKVPPLKALAPTQSEPPFVVTQVVALGFFVLIAVLSLTRFRIPSPGSSKDGSSQATRLQTRRRASPMTPEPDDARIRTSARAAILNLSRNGATTLAGSDGSRQPSENELTIARFQGKHVAEITSKLLRGAKA